MVSFINFPSLNSFGNFRPRYSFCNILNNKIRNSNDVCSAHIVVFWYVGVSYLHGGGGAMCTAEGWFVTLAMEVCEDMHVAKVDIYRSRFVLQHGRLYWILLYILRWFGYFLFSEFFFFNKYINFTFFTKCKLSMMLSMWPSECLLSSRNQCCP